MRRRLEAPTPSTCPFRIRCAIESTAKTPNLIVEEPPLIVRIREGTRTQASTRCAAILPFSRLNHHHGTQTISPFRLGAIERLIGRMEQALSIFRIPTARAQDCGSNTDTDR